VRGLQRHKHLLLLLALIGILIVHSSEHSTTLARHVLAPLSLLATFVVVFTGRRERVVALAMAVVVIAAGRLQFVPVGEDYRVLGTVVYHGLHVMFFGFAVDPAGHFCRKRRHRRPGGGHRVRVSAGLGHVGARLRAHRDVGTGVVPREGRHPGSASYACMSLYLRFSSR
jgi:hypothetical protein